MGALPMKCRQYLANREIIYEQVDINSQKAIVIRGFKLPLGQFDAATGDILILLPAGYPDSAPDMFYVSPWLRLATNSLYPRAADQPFDFNGTNWQRWSSHNNEWRPGIDGIWTTIKRIETALEVAS